MSKFNIQMTNDWVRHTDTSTKHGHETNGTDPGHETKIRGEDLTRLRAQKLRCIL